MQIVDRNEDIIGEQDFRDDLENVVVANGGNKRYLKDKLNAAHIYFFSFFNNGGMLSSANPV